MTRATNLTAKVYDDTTIGRHVRILRNARGMSSAELATLCDISYTKASHLENGSIPFDLPLLIKLADILDTTPGRLLDGPVTHRMIDLTGVADEQASALELLAQTLASAGAT